MKGRLTADDSDYEGSGVGGLECWEKIEDSGAGGLWGIIGGEANGLESFFPLEPGELSFGETACGLLDAGDAFVAIDFAGEEEADIGDADGFFGGQGEVWEGGNFIDGRTAFSIGISTIYQNAWQIDLSYTNYSGASRYNLINDRDFLGGFVKYSF